MKKNIAPIFIICLFIFALFYVYEVNGYKLSSTSILKEELKKNPQISKTMISRTGKNYAEYLYKVDNGLYFVVATKNRLFWKLENASYYDYSSMDTDDFTDVFYIQMFHFDEKEVDIFGMCKNDDTKRIKVVSTDGNELTYNVDSSLFCMSVKQNLLSELRLYGINQTGKVIWEYMFSK